jgi:5-methylcytosine-specific restriction endonuclease McrA
MRLTKKQRDAVKMKYGGRCAYCGCELSDRWHADHLVPVMREVKTVRTEKGYRLTSEKPMRPENDTIENLMPACPSCNIDKHILTIEEWRDDLQRTVNTLNSYSRAYKFARRFGLVEETGRSVSFHFEREKP